MSIRLLPTFLAGLFVCGTASAGQLALNPASHQELDRPAPLQQVAVQGPNLGGGFFEMLFGGPGRASPQPGSYSGAPAEPYYSQSDAGAPQAVDPRYLKQEGSYDGKEAPATLLTHT